MKLKEWLEQNRYTYPAFANLLKEHGHAVTSQAVQKWTVGHMPRREALVAILAATDGVVTLASFMD